MTVTYGFYNSLNHDRQYDAIQLSSIFDGILLDGIFATFGDALIVAATTGMIVSVGTGRAWFNHTWTYNDAALNLTVLAAEAILNRIDVVVLEVDSSDAVRANTIKIIKGTPGSVPVAPTMANTTTLHQYALAHIYIGAGVTSIVGGNITNKIGLTATPFVTGVIDTITTDALIAQWNAQFDAWFTAIQGQLTGDPATKLTAVTNRLNRAQIETLGGTRSLSDSDANYLILDPGGVSRKVLLPVEGADNHFFWILNNADVEGEIITVKDHSDTTTLAILGRREHAIVIMTAGGTAYNKLDNERKTIAMTKPFAVAVGDGYMYIPIPYYMANAAWPWSIYKVEALVSIAGTTNSMQIQLNNGAQDLLTTKLYIDSGGYASRNAGTQPVLNSLYLSLSGVTHIRVDIDVISTTPAQNLSILVHAERQ